MNYINILITKNDNNYIKNNNIILNLEKLMKIIYIDLSFVS